MEYHEISADIARITERTNSLSDRITSLESRTEKQDRQIEALKDQNVTIERLTVILDEIRKDSQDQHKINQKITDTLAQIKDTMMVTNGKIENLANAQDKANQKLNEMDNRIEAVDNKSKVDFLTYIRDNWFKWTLGTAGIGGICYLLSQLFSL